MARFGGKVLDSKAHNADQKEKKKEKVCCSKKWAVKHLSQDTKLCKGEVWRPLEATSQTLVTDIEQTLVRH